MTEEGPEIYLFDGDDEFAINESIAKIISRLGDANIAGMNTTRLDGRSFILIPAQRCSRNGAFPGLQKACHSQPPDLPLER